MIVNNGTYRRTEFRFEKYVDGNLVFSGGFPLTVSFIAPFAQHPSISEEELSSMDENQYQSRLNDFYQYLTIQFPFFNVQEHIPDPQDELINSNGQDLESCPIDLSPQFLPYVNLQVDYFQMEDGLEAIIKVQSIDRAGNPVLVAEDVNVDFILKEAGKGAESIWDAIDGQIKTVIIPSGFSEAIAVPRFRYRGVETDMLYKSVFVQLFSGENSGDFKLIEPTKISLTLNQPAFLTNFISTLAESYQDQLSVNQVNELIKSGIGQITTGKDSYNFSFKTGIPQRPVFLYPASWGLLSTIIYKQGYEADILEAGGFLLEDQMPFEASVNIDGVSVNYFVYSARNLIIYPKKADYTFNF
jgi:hypothetical protein